MKNYFRNSIILAAMAVGVLTSCEDDLAAEQETPNAPYVLSLGVTANGNTTYYVVSTDNLMEGTINAVGKGMFDNSLSGFCQVDANTMVGLELPTNKESGSQLTFYTVDANTAAILAKNTDTAVDPIDRLDWPSITGMMYSGGNLYVTYTPMNSMTFETAYTDTCFVAVYSYPDMQFVKLMKDTRVGPGGSWGAFNGYVMSNSAISNGYSQSTKHAGFLRINKGETEFDADYFFDFEELTGGLKPAHVAYVGNGLVFAEVSTLNPQTANDRWGDKSLKCCIIDLVNQTVTDVEGIPVHNGNGGRRFAYLTGGNNVYLPVSTSDGVYIYRTDVTTARAERGARVSTTFVGGFFQL